MIDCGAVVLCGNAGDLPFHAVFSQEPSLPINQQTGECPADMSKTYEGEIDLSSFLIHCLSIFFLWNELPSSAWEHILILGHAPGTKPDITPDSAF